MPGRQQIPQEVPEKSAGMLLIELYAILYNFALNPPYDKKGNDSGMTQKPWPDYINVLKHLL